MIYENGWIFQKVFRVVLYVFLAVTLNGTAQAADWSSAADLITARENHSATLLPDGHVLVAGGEGAAGILASAEIYDPARNTWSPAGNLSVARRYHTATLLPNGRVLVVAGGGDLDVTFASAELYDPVSNSWSSAGNLSASRRFHSATLLPNGYVLVAGGNVGPASLAGTELYDPAANSWSTAGTMTDARYSHSATLLPDGQVLVAGGQKTSSTYYSSTTIAGIELYDPARNSWSPAVSLTTARNSHSATLLHDGRILVTGGGQSFSFGYEGKGKSSSTSLNSAELYDPGTDTWLPTDSMSSNHGSHSAILLSDGNVLVVGGSAELYDPLTDSWSPAGNMAAVRFNHSATLLPDKRVLVAGGWDRTEGQTASAELYGSPEMVSNAGFPWLILQPALDFNSKNFNADALP